MPTPIKTLADLGELTPARGLHARIMRRIFFINFRPHLAWLAGLLALNIGVSLWHFINRAHELATFSVIQTLADNFELTLDYATNSTSMFFDSLPVGSMLILVINAVLTIYIIRLMVLARNAS